MKTETFKKGFSLDGTLVKKNKNKKNNLFVSGPLVKNELYFKRP